MKESFIEVQREIPAEKVTGPKSHVLAMEWSAIVAALYREILNQEIDNVKNFRIR